MWWWVVMIMTTNGRAVRLCMMIVLYDHAHTHTHIFLHVYILYLYLSTLYIYMYVFISFWCIHYIYTTIWTLSFFCTPLLLRFSDTWMVSPGWLWKHFSPGARGIGIALRIESWESKGAFQCHLKPQEIRPYNLLGNYQGAMMVNSPLVRPHVLRGLPLGAGTLRFPWC